MKEKIQDAVDRLTPQLVALRRQIHRRPELAMREVETSRLIRESLEQSGIESQFIFDNVGVTALIEGGHPGDTIALRADIDALPMDERTGLPFASEVPQAMHACGHDIHAAVLLGAALILAANSERLYGNVRLIFQSAEEKLAGSLKAIEAGLLASPPVKSISALHCWPDFDAGTVGLRRGPMMAASDGVRLVVHGRGGHAAYPHSGRDPITALALIIAALQTIVSREISPLDSAVLTFGMISGGTAPNVIPAEAQASGTCRTLSSAVRDGMGERIARVAGHVALALGAECEVEYTRQCPPVINDDALVDAAETSIKEMLGGDKVRFLSTPTMGSEDFAFYLERVPGMMMRLGTGGANPATRLALHNAGLVFEEDAIPTGVKALSALAFHLLSV